jgi:hypothetical protein
MPFSVGLMNDAAANNLIESWPLRLYSCSLKNPLNAKTVQGTHDIGIYGN